MTQRRLNMSDIPVGKPLPWDVHDPNGHLLLRKGYVIERHLQAKALVERGLLAETFLGPHYRQNAASQHAETPSVLRLINRANTQLNRLLFDLRNEPDFPGKLVEIAELVRFATEVNPDIAIACILLNQQTGPYPVRHCIDTAVLSILIARSMEIAPVDIVALTAAALTMNIGMIRHHVHLERKQQSLSDDTIALIRRHPQEGVKILESKGVRDQNWLAYVLSHHENEDGTGYPFGAIGKDIPLPAKIISLADRYCACVSARDFRKSMLPNAALRDIFLDGGKSIDPVLAAQFIKELGIYPPGTFVRLINGEIGVVSKKGGCATTPTVHALVGPRGAPLAFPIKRDTAKEMFAIKESLREEQAAIHFSLRQVWGNEASL